MHRRPEALEPCREMLDSGKQGIYYSGFRVAGLSDLRR